MAGQPGCIRPAAAKDGAGQGPNAKKPGAATLGFFVEVVKGCANIKLIAFINHRYVVADFRKGEAATHYFFAVY